MNKLSLLVSLTLCLFFFATYTHTSLKLYRAHHTRGDLTAYAQGMWNTLQGNFMASTYNYSVHDYYGKDNRRIEVDNSNIFGIHFNPILLLFIPIYYLFPRPETLLIIQALLTSTAGLFVFLLARSRSLNNLVSLSISMSFFLYLSVVSAVLSQFHAYTLAIFFGFFFILVSDKKRIIYYPALLMFLMVQENTPLIATFYGLYLCLNRKLRLRGIVTTLLSSIYFFTLIQHIIPQLNPEGHYQFQSIYGSPLGNSIFEIIITSLTKPILLGQTIFGSENLSYLSDLLFPVYPFAIFSPTSLIIAFSALAQNLLSSSLGLKTHLMHYESGSIPFIYLSLVLGLSYLFVWLKNPKSKIFMSTLVITSLFITTAISYKRHTSHIFNPSFLTTNLYQKFDSDADELISLIDPKYSVSTQDYLSAHLAGRDKLYQFPIYSDQSDFILITTTNQVWPLTIEEQQEYLQNFKSSQSVQTVRENDNFILFTRLVN